MPLRVKAFVPFSGPKSGNPRKRIGYVFKTWRNKTINSYFLILAHRLLRGKASFLRKRIFQRAVPGWRPGTALFVLESPHTNTMLLPLSFPGTRGFFFGEAARAGGCFPGAGTAAIFRCKQEMPSGDCRRCWRCWCCWRWMVVSKQLFWSDSVVAAGVV